MKQPDFVQFQQNQNDSVGSELQSPLYFDKVTQLNDGDTMHRRKSHGMKKKKALYTADQIDELKKLNSEGYFPISISLLNLFRNPQVEDHEFSESFLRQVESNLRAVI